MNQNDVFLDWVDAEMLDWRFCSPVRYVGFEAFEMYG